MSHQEDVDRIIATLRAVVHAIPGYGIPMSGHSRSLVRNGTLPARFLYEAGNATDGHPRLERVSEANGEEIRDGLAFCDAYDTVATEMELLTRGVRFAVAAKRAQIGRKALRIYRMARELNRDDRNQTIVPHIVIMAEALAQRRRRRASKEEAAEATPEAAPEDAAE
jgi:hypothetical protein